MTPMKYEYPPDEEIKKLIFQGMSFDSIARKYNIPFSAFRSHILRQNLTLKALGAERDPIGEVVDRNIELLLEVMHGGGTFADAAKLINMDVTIFRNYMQRNGVTKELIQTEGVQSVMESYKIFRETRPQKFRKLKVPQSAPVQKQGVYYFVCETCGKIVSTLYIGEWAYKLRYKDNNYYTCSYSCNNKLKKKLNLD